MPDVLRYALVAAVVFIAHFQEGVTGFGCAVLSLPALAMLIGLDVAVPMMVLIGWLFSSLIVLESRKHIIWSEFWRITILVGLGLPIGMVVAKSVSPTILKWFLAAFLVIVGSYGLAVQMSNKPTPKMTQRMRLVTSAFLPLGGIIHGVFGTGGPLIVIYATRAITDKTVFRVTLSLMWVVMATLMIGHWAFTSSLPVHSIKLAACILPASLTALYLGNKAHYRVDEIVFRKVVYAVLIASGFALMWSLVA